MTCPDALLLDAYFDRELDAAGTLAIEHHLADCAICTVAHAQNGSLRSELRAHATYYRAPSARRQAWLDTLSGSQPSPLAAPFANSLAGAQGTRDTARMIPGLWRTRWSKRSYWTGAASGAIAASLFAVGLLFSPTSPSTNALASDLVDAHVRSLMSQRLIDVASSDHHTVKPWFAGRADVAPPVDDFPKQDFHLVGGRMDFIDGHRAAVVVYRHGAHIINVFAWPAQTPAFNSMLERNGYHLLCWRDGTLNVCAISDTAPSELRTLQALMAPSSGSRENL